MPGATNNTDTVSALNQLIQAVNELTIATTNLNLCCCNNEGVQPPQPPIGPGDGPPPGMSVPTGNIDARRCKIAIWLIDYWLRPVTHQLDILHYDEFLSGGVTVTGAMIGVAIAGVPSLATGPGLVFGAGIGAAVGVALSLTLGPDFTDIKSYIDGNRDKLICTMASSANGMVAKGAFLRIFNSTGATLGDLAYLNAIMPTHMINLLFFVNDYFPNIETFIDNLPDPCPCQDITSAAPTTLTDEYKCKAANYIFDGFKGTAANLGTLTSFAYMSLSTFITSLIEGLLGTLMVGIFANVAGLAGILAAVVSGLSTLAWRGFNFFNVFTTVAASLQANKTAIVCELYNAANAADPIVTARAALEARIETYIDAAVANTEFVAEADTFKSVLKLLLSNVVLNALAEVNEDADDYNVEGMVDCIGCEPCHTVNVLVGEVSGTWPTFTFTSGTEQGCPWLQFKVNWDEQTDQACGPMAKIVSYSGAPAGGGLICGGARRFYAEDDSSTVYSGQNSSMDTVSNICLRYWSIVAEAPFTLTITFEDC
jgi:hypothetical protein